MNWTRDDAKSLVRRFGSIARPPDEPEAIGVTIDTLWHSCESREQAERVVADIIESPGDPIRWPTPDRIRAVAYRHKPRGGPRCEHCDGMGWRSKPIFVKGIEYPNCVRCVCNGGKLPPPQRDGKMSSAAEVMEGVVW